MSFEIGNEYWKMRKTYKHSEETKRKISKARKGKPLNHKIDCQCYFCRLCRGEIKAKDNYNYGKKASEKTRERISKSKIGNKYMLGKTLNNEQKQKIVDAHLNKSMEKCERENLDYVITQDGIYIIKLCPNCGEERYIKFCWRNCREGFCCVACKNEFYGLGHLHTNEVRKRIKKSIKEKMDRGEMPEPWNKGTHIQTNTGRTHFKKGQFALDKHPQWNGGISFEPYGVDFNEELKEQVRKRDNYTCQECGYTEEQLGYTLNIHHIDYNKKNNSEDNLISLCKSCHGKTNWNREDWIEYYKDKISSYHHKKSYMKELP